MSRANQLEQQIAQLSKELKYEYSKNAAKAPMQEAYTESDTPMQPGGQLGYAGQANIARDPIDDVFTFHDNPDAAPHYIEIREAAKTFARVIDRHAPWSEDKRSALGCVRAAVMWANAAVALNGRGL